MGSARTANRAADRAWLRLSCCALKLTDIVTPRGNRTSLAGQCWHCCEPHREHSGTGIWPDRDIPTSRRHVTAPRSSLSTAPPPPPRTPAGKARLLDAGGRNPARHGLSAGGNRIRTIGPAPAKGSSGRCQSETAARKAEPLTGSGPKRQCLPGVATHSLSLRGGTASSNPSSSSGESTS
jgi:hypothetical protein